MLFKSFFHRFSSLSLPQLESIGVVGSGQMGTGIAIVANRKSNYPVTIVDSNENSLKKAKAFVESHFDKEIAKKTMNLNDKNLYMSRFAFSRKLEDMGKCQFVIEAVTENFEVKRGIFEKLDEILPKNAILASNTSSISITKLAKFVKRPKQVIGMHFMNPVPVMTLVEVIKGLETSEETLDLTKNLAEKMKKEIVISKDSPGFIINRVLMPYINEAVFVLSEGVATKENIDKGTKIGLNLPMGPLTLADFIGLDTCLAIMEVLHKDLFDDKYRPCPLLRQYVDAGRLGRKNKKGFFDY